MKKRTLTVIAVLVLILVLALGGVYTVARSRTATKTTPTIINTARQRTYYPTQAECETASSKSCEQVMCDYAPEGKTIEDVCGKNYRKGYWSAKAS